jgi:hypothetical protein
MNSNGITRCEALLDGKIRCSMVKGEGHGPMHKRITPTGRVTHTWPVAEPARLDADRTATPKTRIVAHPVVGDEGTAFVPPGDTYVAEDGSRVKLR